MTLNLQSVAPLPTPGMNSPKPVNYVLVDFENVCEIDTTILADKNVFLVLLVGAGRTTLDLALVEKLLLYSSSVQLVRLRSKGKNALDFTLAYYLGCSAAGFPNGFFHIISKDKGFDPLVEHLQSKHIRVRRHDSFTSLNFSARPTAVTGAPATKSTNPNPSRKLKGVPPDSEVLTEQVLAHLRNAPSNRPKTLKKLVSYVLTHLGNGSGAAQAESLVENLKQAGHLVIDAKGVITYGLEDAESVNSVEPVT